MTTVPIFQERDYCIPNGGVRGNVILAVRRRSSRLR